MEITIPKKTLDSLGKPIKDTGAAGGGTPTAEELAAQKVKDDEAAAAAAGGGGAGGGAGGAGAEPPPGSGSETPPDLSLLEGADQTLVTSLETILTKNEADLTEDEQKTLDDNLELVKAIANQEVDPVIQLMADEGYLEDGEFGEGLDGIKGYIAARDEKRDSSVVSNYLEENAEVKALAEHLKANKPLATFLAQVQKPAILETQLVEMNDQMTDDQKADAIAQYKGIVEASLRASKVDTTLINSIVKGAEADGSLATMAKSSLKSLNDMYNAQIEDANKAAVAKHDQDQKDEQMQRDKIAGIVKSGKLTDTIAIPESDKATFTKFVNQPVNDKGQTLADIQYSKLSLEQRTALDYIVYKGLKIPQVSKVSVMSKYIVGKKANEARKPPVKGVGGANIGLGKLNLKEIAKSQNLI